MSTEIEKKINQVFKTTKDFDAILENWTDVKASIEKYRSHLKKDFYEELDERLKKIYPSGVERYSEKKPEKAEICFIIDSLYKNGRNQIKFKIADNESVIFFGLYGELTEKAKKSIEYVQLKENIKIEGEKHQEFDDNGWIHWVWLEDSTEDSFYFKIKNDKENTMKHFIDKIFSYMQKWQSLKTNLNL